MRVRLRLIYRQQTSNILVLNTNDLNMIFLLFPHVIPLKSLQNKYLIFYVNQSKCLVYRSLCYNLAGLFFKKIALYNSVIFVATVLSVCFSSPSFILPLVSIAIFSIVPVLVCGTGKIRTLFCSAQLKYFANSRCSIIKNLNRPC